jgi:predicted TIM-barrel fold metal-dependent hydrolase
MHIYESRAQGQNQKDSYEILEYGQSASVQFAHRAGDLQDALASMADAGFAYAVVANLFYTIASNDGIVECSPGSPVGTNVLHSLTTARDRLSAYNRWVASLGRTHPQLIPFVSLDPWVMSSDEMCSHLMEMVSDFGARGVKLHPIAQRFAANDERMLPAFRLCADMQIPVLIHSGTSTANTYAEPRTLARLLSDVPTLRLLVAHLGGGAWRQTLELAKAHPNILFDCAEIIAWTGAPMAPSQRDLARLIRDVGPERVLLGSDFPWYDLGKTVEQVLALPILAAEEKDLILGLNAAKLLNLATQPTL